MPVPALNFKKSVSETICPSRKRKKTIVSFRSLELIKLNDVVKPKYQYVVTIKTWLRKNK